MTDAPTAADWTSQVTSAAIVRLSPDGTITSFNPGAEHIKGYKAAEVLGTSFTRFYRRDDQLRGLPLQLLTIARNRGSVEDNGWRVKADGSLFWAHVVITALRDETGELIGFVKIVTDQTSEKQRQDAELTFMRAFTHDFLSPLSAVRGYVDILEESPAPSREVFAHLSTATDHLLAMATRLSQRLREAVEDSSRARADAVAAVRAAAELILPGDAFGRVRIAGAPRADVLIDTLSFRRAVANIIDNAAKYSDGAIDILVEAAADDVVIAIADSGRGIAAPDLDRIFEPLERGRLSDPGDGGLGMGLASARALIEDDGGSIGIHSAQDVGTTVTIRLPAAGSMPAAGETDEHPGTDASTGPSVRGSSPAAPTPGASARAA